MKILPLLLLVFSLCRAQTGLLTIQECYKLAELNYPLVKQRELISKATAYTIENIQKGYLPQLNVNGQATYQSAVTEVPIRLPGMTVPGISKDQYKVYAELSQLVYDGGTLKQQEELQKTSEGIEQQKLETELYKLKERINQLFFGLLLIDEQLKQNVLLIKDIQLGLTKVQAAIANGIALRSNADVLRADLLKNSQRSIELDATRRAYAEMLSVFIGRPVESGLLLKPNAPGASQEIKRPELFIYAAQHKNLDVQDRILSSKTLPRMGLFLQGGMGRPALNMLSNSFNPYFITGLRLSWSPSIFYTLKKDRALLGISRINLEVQKETFLFNTNLTLRQQNAEINKYRELLSSDDEIIALRSKVKATSIVQLENGVIQANDYLREANAEDQAKQSKLLHEIQLLMAQFSQRITAGDK